MGTFCFVIVPSTCAAQSVLFHCVRTRNAVDGAGLAHSIISSSFRGGYFKGILVQLSRTLPFKILPGIVVLQQSLLDYIGITIRKLCTESNGSTSYAVDKNVCRQNSNQIEKRNTNLHILVLVGIGHRGASRNGRRRWATCNCERGTDAGRRF